MSLESVDYVNASVRGSGLFQSRQLADFGIVNLQKFVPKGRNLVSILPIDWLIPVLLNLKHIPRIIILPMGTRMMQLSEKKKIMILGGGPNRIGQGIEFDYCCVHASFALREAGLKRSWLIPIPKPFQLIIGVAFYQTDCISSHLPWRRMFGIYRQEKCDGAIVQYGGQTPLNLATTAWEARVNVISTSPESIDAAEDREKFKAILDELESAQATVQ